MGRPERTARKRNWLSAYLDSDSDEEGSMFSRESSNSDEEFQAPKRKAPKRQRVKKEKEPPTKASIANLATDGNDNVDAQEREAKLGQVGHDILERIKGALRLANHPGTGENEAKAALRQASKLMAKHNVTQAEIIARENSQEKLKRAGMSVVIVRSTKDTQVMCETWASGAASAVTKFFDCKFYTTTFEQIDRVSYTFYGLAEQTVAAAHAYEMVYNQIMRWSMDKTEAKGRNAKNAYRRGVADGLWNVAIREKNEEQRNAERKEKLLLEAARKQEEEDDKKRLERLQQPDIADDALVAIKVEEDDTISSDHLPNHANGALAAVKVEEDDKSTLEGLKEPGLATDASVAIKIEVKMESEPRAEGNKKVTIIDVEDEDAETATNPAPLEDTVENKPANGMNTGNGTDHYPDIDHADFEYDPGDFQQADFHENDEDEDGEYDLPSLRPEPALDGELSRATPGLLGTGPEPNPPTLVDTIAEEEPDETPWNSVGALTTFRAQSVAVADEYLASVGVELSTKRKTPKIMFKDQHARRMYKDGEEDAKKIDVKRRRLKAAEDDS
ncbi:hypothetical protein PUNSTDRAFT_132068 [Punctularia strigosozonata HHB-11173 SS5]|uniref:uncharacterized protein n=1 Tax=Punctularia strigosozonata (strain HHB-11173) TaxID=741275 RepID=UPI0004416C4D|nr:uncharacterized protein PUNSTDRAFT_132068 [Punctularia strigosozonata HHB-11173 SS5]EIN11922.1 hypothetical protein PUNSTDRAFT_132068 [Punctularia strigosozonata HHB-11173 SS5]